MKIYCNECGCPYESSSSACPECGNPTPIFKNTTGLTNCPNCGAPVTNNNTCEYCGSAYPHAVPEGPQVINNTTVIHKNEGSSIGTGAAAFLGGVVGALLDD